MSYKFATFVINLESATDRKAHMTKQLADVGMSFEIMRAVNGKSLAPEYVAQVYDAAGAREIQRRPLAPGEIGCALSHVSIYQAVLDRDLSVALVLEDDARLNSDFSRLIKPLTESIVKETRPTIYLLTHLMRYKRKLLQEVGGSHGLHQMVDACCAHGYLINRAAAAVMADMFSPICYPIDAWTRIAETGRIRILGLNPYIIGHSELSKESNLEMDRGAIDTTFQPVGLGRLSFYLRFYLYEKFVYQIYKAFVGIKKQHKQTWDLR